MFFSHSKRPNKKTSASDLCSPSSCVEKKGIISDVLFLFCALSSVYGVVFYCTPVLTSASMLWYVCTGCRDAIQCSMCLVLQIYSVLLVCHM